MHSGIHSHVVELLGHPLQLVSLPVETVLLSEPPEVHPIVHVDKTIAWELGPARQAAAVLQCGSVIPVDQVLVVVARPWRMDRHLLEAVGCVDIHHQKPVRVLIRRCETPRHRASGDCQDETSLFRQILDRDLLHLSVPVQVRPPLHHVHEGKKRAQA